MRQPASMGKPYCLVLLRLHCNQAEGTELISSYSAPDARNHQANETTGTTWSPATRSSILSRNSARDKLFDNNIYTTRLCKYPMAVRAVRATQTAIIAHLHHSTRILHNSQYSNTPHFFTYHLRMGWALCRKHKNAWFERVSPQSQKAILSDYLPMKTLPPTAETWWGICPEGHKGPWRLACLTPLSWMSLLHRSMGRQGGGRSTALKWLDCCLSPLHHPAVLHHPPASLPAPSSAFRLHAC